ncbi:MAG: hypothetical protein Q9227_006107 [Pyrenula ochraceoflavens]
MSTYPVYKAQYHLSLQDPSLPGPRYHTVIFILTSFPFPGHGIVHHVTGDLVTGYTYSTRPEPPFDSSPTFHASQYLGQTDVATYPRAIDDLLKQLPAPPRQRVFSPGKMAYVRCRQDGTVYGEGEEVPELEKCTEWIERKAIPALLQQGIVR